MACNRRRSGRPRSRPAAAAASSPDAGAANACSGGCSRLTGCRPFRYGFIGGPSGQSGSAAVRVTVKNRSGPLRHMEVALHGANNIYRTAMTGADGTVVFNFLPPGHYQINSCGCCKTVCLGAAGTQTVVFCCPCVTCTGNVYIRLFSGTNGSPLGRGVFAIYNRSGRQVVRGTTAADGTLTFTGLPCAQYELRQVSAPPLYSVSPVSRIFRLSENNFEIRIYNRPAPVL